MSKVKVPDPKPFGGARSAKELENFLWDMETYFQAARIPEAEKVSITSMYLTGDAKLWWRTRLSDDPVRIGTESRRTVRDYVKEFSSLMLDVRDMSEEDKLFNFLSGLQTWAQTELRRQGVKDLPSAISAADRLVDFRVTNTLIQKRKERILERRRGSPVRRGRMENLRRRSTKREQGRETRRPSSPTLTERRRAVTSAMVTTACGTVLSEGN
ncbi:UNVERIFIED_CONTAM: hypothetical protein Sangu_0572100 [Sesamum angustifolium]|uniref:Retrotransposon gag domain-containing protein n=1 Tax=Sesamum angustifolium TaxID=2727405 RepID=A0AAW2QA46_9LAMI